MDKIKNDMIRIGTFVLDYRTDQGLTQEELAEMMTVNKDTVSRMEHGSFSLTTFLLFCRVFGLDVMEILQDPVHRKKDRTRYEEINRELWRLPENKRDYAFDLCINNIRFIREH